MDHGLYISHLREVFMAFMVLADGPKENYQKQLVLDGANGIGAIIMKEFMGQAGCPERLNITMINDEKAPDNLNEGCGAEYVQKDQKLPNNWVAGTHANMKCISFDGDADRQIYYYGDEAGNLNLIDCDKQFSLIMMYVTGLLKKAGAYDKVSHIFV